MRCPAVIVAFLMKFGAYRSYIHVHRPLCIRLLYGVVTSHIWVVIYEKYILMRQCCETVKSVCVLYLYRLCCFCVLFMCLPVCECTYVCVGYGVKWLQELVISESSTLYRYTGTVPYNSCVLHNYCTLCMSFATPVLIDIQQGLSQSMSVYMYKMFNAQYKWCTVHLNACA